MSNTKVFVFRLKEILYTAFFVVLGVVLIILLIFMFTGRKGKDTSQASNEFIPGVYTASVTLENRPINVEVTLDKNHINSVKLVDLDPVMQTLYPLLQPAMEDIEAQLVIHGSTELLTINDEYYYTSELLIDAINRAIDKAKVK